MKRERIKNPAPPASDLEKTLPNPFKEMEVVLRDLANDAMKIYPQIDKDIMSGLFLKEEENAAAAVVASGSAKILMRGLHEKKNHEALS